jgi:hypothetical protein
MVGGGTGGSTGSSPTQFVSLRELSDQRIRGRFRPSTQSAAFFRYG